MFRHLRDVRARRRGEEFIESGFTLIELLVVIVVLGILAATVVFALTGVTGQSAQAACNSDAKTIEVGVQAYINSPNNSTNSPPATLQNLVAAPFNKTGDPLTSGTGDTFLADIPSNSAYDVNLYGALTTAQQATITTTPTPAADGVVVEVPKSTGVGAWFAYDSQGNPNPCSNVS